MTGDDRDLEAKEMNRVVDDAERVLDEAERRVEAVGPKLANAVQRLADVRSVTRHLKEQITLQKRLAKARQANSLYLVDKFLPVLIAMLGGIAYVLLEHKTHNSYALNFFRVSGALLTLAVICLFLQLWREPSVTHKFEQLELGIKHGQKPDYDSIEPYKRGNLILRLLRLIMVVSGGLGILMAAVAVGFESFNHTTSP